MGEGRLSRISLAVAHHVGRVRLAGTADGAEDRDEDDDQEETDQSNQDNPPDLQEKSSLTAGVVGIVQQNCHTKRENGGKMTRK